MSSAREAFAGALRDFAATVGAELCTPDGQWAVKGFVDVDRRVYSISGDTKVTSKILEIHLFPYLREFAGRQGMDLTLCEHQNHYPDMSFVARDDPRLRFAVDLKTTYRRADRPGYCNGFTLGSHGEYFRNRQSTKNILFPYGTYAAHFCLGVIYDRAPAATIDETVRVGIEQLGEVASVMSGMHFFVQEKWRLASDRRGSGNTANIGSIDLIDDVVAGRGTFSRLGEAWFDDYWMNYGLLMIGDGTGGATPLTRLSQLVAYRGGDPALIVPRGRRAAA